MMVLDGYIIPKCSKLYKATVPGRMETYTNRSVECGVFSNYNQRALDVQGWNYLWNSIKEAIAVNAQDKEPLVFHK